MERFNTFAPHDRQASPPAETRLGRLLNAADPTTPPRAWDITNELHDAIDQIEANRKTLTFHPEEVQR